jgi:hypothetical protein
MIYFVLKFVFKKFVMGKLVENDINVFLSLLDYLGNIFFLFHKYLFILILFNI